MSAVNDILSRARGRKGDTHSLISYEDGAYLRLSIEEIASGAELCWIRLDRKGVAVLRDQCDRFIGDRKPTLWARARRQILVATAGR